GGSPEKIFPGYRFVAGVEPSGKGLYLTRRNRHEVSELDFVPLPAGPPVPLATLHYGDDAWVSKDGIYYLGLRDDDEISPVALYFRTHAGAVTLLQEFSTAPGRGLSVSADGRFALTSRANPTISDLMLLETAK